MTKREPEWFDDAVRLLVLSANIEDTADSVTETARILHISPTVLHRHLFAPNSTLLAALRQRSLRAERNRSARLERLMDVLERNADSGSDKQVIAAARTLLRRLISSRYTDSEKLRESLLSWLLSRDRSWHPLKLAPHPNEGEMNDV